MALVPAPTSTPPVGIVVKPVPPNGTLTEVPSHVPAAMVPKVVIEF
jgi:hypothetical protein